MSQNSSVEPPVTPVTGATSPNNEGSVAPSTNFQVPPAQGEIGLRVSIRLFDDEGGFRDLLGRLETPTQVRKKDGTLREFDPLKIFLWKVVPE